MEIELKIPAGVEHGMQLSVSGKGNMGARNGVAGDLIVLIEEEEHPELKRDGNNILFDLYISFADAILDARQVKATAAMEEMVTDKVEEVETVTEVKAVKEADQKTEAVQEKVKSESESEKNKDKED